MVKTATKKKSKATNKPIHIVTIGGGSGQFALLSGLRKLPDIHISAVVSMMDSGGSTGRLRDELGTLPPGDILKCVLALSPHQEMARSVFQKRFKKDRRLKGHNAGNMLLTMLSRYTGSFPAGVQALAEILDVQGEILPVTIDRATLVAELTDGSRIFGESAIDMPRGHQRETIRDVYLVPHHSDAITVYPPVLKAIDKADIVILGPGDLFTSIIPNLLVPGLKEKLASISVPIYQVVNIMTKFGETNHFQACDFIATLESFTGRRLTGAIVNNRRPDDRLLNLYHKQKSDFVDIGFNDDRCPLIVEDLLETSGDIIRHDPTKLAGVIEGIIESALT
ncbi:putative gluconeogenesis factor [Desulfosarcina widdelii]|uniref:Putative gluconeogenesis factor n=1 Tax=Desulfosarcina widdelii TaxID=947919 RepID=A0A5K7Z055_9BACT|nr:uridine diphosphate-N-acetylglucosamine-binding protein YvcK [Desulfosarcina widdelii]BBO72811.1 putative gluconeogenesis factor [Desulfosarcina widdelii]